MKKTLAVAAVLAAFAGSAAADVTVYGSFDTGLYYQHNAGGADTVQMKHSMNETSKFALKGSEKISDGLTVGFKMEMALEADTGKAANGAFEREMLGYVKTAYGEIGLGRTGSIGASTGSYAFLGSGNTGFGGGMAAVGDNGFIFLGKDSRLDNSVTYKSPTMGGVTLFAQVGTADADEAEYTHNVDRFYGIGAQYAAGALKAGLVYTLTDVGQDGYEAKRAPAKPKEVIAAQAEEVTTSLSGFVTYDFGVAKVMAAAQYFDGVKSATGKFATDTAEEVAACNGLEGFGASLAVSAPVAGGTAKALVGYASAEDIVTGDEQVRNQVAAAYVYPLSKQSGLYAAAGYTNVEYKVDSTRDEVFTGLVGLYHNF